MGSDNECHVVIANGRSGFCDCGAEGRVGFTCEHPAFTCADVCDKGRPADEDSMSCISWRRTGRCSARGPREDVRREEKNFTARCVTSCAVRAVYR